MLYVTGTMKFFWVKYIEEVGTGTNKIIEWCFDWGLPEPEFEFTGTSLIVSLRKFELTDEYIEQLGLNDRQKIKNSSRWSVGGEEPTIFCG